MFQENVPNMNSVPIKTGNLKVWDWVCLCFELHKLFPTPSLVHKVESQEAYKSYSYVRSLLIALRFTYESVFDIREDSWGLRFDFFWNFSAVFFHFWRVSSKSNRLFCYFDNGSKGFNGEIEEIEFLKLKLGKECVKGFTVDLKLFCTFLSLLIFSKYQDSNSSRSKSVTCVFTHFSGSCLVGSIVCYFYNFGVNKSGSEIFDFQRSPIVKSFQKIENLSDTWEIFGKMTVSD